MPPHERHSVGRGEEQAIEGLPVVAVTGRTPVVKAAVIANGRGYQIIRSLETEWQRTPAARAGHNLRTQIRRIVATYPADDTAVRPLIAPYSAENRQSVGVRMIVIGGHAAVGAAQPQLTTAHIVTAKQSPSAADGTPQPRLLPASLALRVAAVRR